MAAHEAPYNQDKARRAEEIKEWKNRMLVEERRRRVTNSLGYILNGILTMLAGSLGGALIITILTNNKIIHTKQADDLILIFLLIEIPVVILTTSIIYLINIYRK